MPQEQTAGPAARKIGNREFVPAATAFGHTMLVPRDDTIGRSILKHGIYDRKGIAIMNALLQQMQEPVVLDIGANIGNHALAMGTVAHTVHCFEPQLGIFQVLRENIDSNGIGNIAAHNLGLATTAVEQEIYIPARDNLGAATLRNELKAEDALVETIRLEAGDAFIDGLGLQQLDLVKIDVEGFEIQVLEGLRETVDRFRPVIFMEWDQAITKREAGESAIFQQLVEPYLPYQVGSNYDRELWPANLPGRLRRVFYKALHSRKWTVREADLVGDYGNLILVPRERTALVESLPPQVL